MRNVVQLQLVRYCLTRSLAVHGPVHESQLLAQLVRLSLTAPTFHPDSLFQPSAQSTASRPNARLWLLCNPGDWTGTSWQSLTPQATSPYISHVACTAASVAPYRDSHLIFLHASLSHAVVDSQRQPSIAGVGSSHCQPERFLLGDSLHTPRPYNRCPIPGFSCVNPDPEIIPAAAALTGPWGDTQFCAPLGSHRTQASSLMRSFGRGVDQVAIPLMRAVRS
jgi:hypothetical protein